MIIVMLVVLGLILGSFVNALVWRLHEQAELREQAEKVATAKKVKVTKEQHAYRKDLSISRGRSMCPHCKHTLSAADLVPVASWVWLRGRCRYCHQPIARQYPLVELLTAALFVASCVWWPEPLSGQGLFDFVVWLVALVGFMALSVYDVRWFELPDRVVLPMTILVAIQSIVDIFIYGGAAQLLSRLGSVVIIGGLFMGLYMLSKGAWIGYGDVKIAVMLGLLAGSPLKILLVIFLASLLGSLAAIPLMVRGKASRSTHIPFGPFLLAATIIVVLFGDNIISAYDSLLLIK